MNNRDYKRSAPGEYYHIYNRGNGKENIFLDDQDFSFFLKRLSQNLFPVEEKGQRIALLPVNSFSLISYCLMPNHFHFLLRQNLDIQPNRLLAKICTSYSKYFNKRYQHVGHVFQDKFKQVNVSDNAYLVWLSAYIHQNPKVAGLVDDLSYYPWSSYGEFKDPTVHGLCDKTIISNQYKDSSEYMKFVSGSFEVIKQKKDLGELLLD